MNKAAPADPSVAYSPMLAAFNERLAADGRGIAIESAQLLTNADGWNAATTLIANNRTHVIGSEFVKSDPRRGGGSNITYLVDLNDPMPLRVVNGVVLPLSTAEVSTAMDASMATWQNAPSCGAPAVTRVAPLPGVDPDEIDGIVFNDPSRIGVPQADITMAGWLGSSFFNALAPGGARSILGVTFTFVFIDDAGNATDIDHDHTSDAAFREIYYNRSFAWTTTGDADHIDVQSVATHEAGHAYGLGHFGKVFIDNNGNWKFSPHAVMNAVYVEPFRELTGTDNSSFCGIWASR